jgi:DNA-binding response OmpR family regulator
MGTSKKTGRLAREESSRPRAMVVDPDEGFLAFAAEALHSFNPGFDVVTVQDLQSAGEWLDSFRPDLLLIGVERTNDASTGLPERIFEAAHHPTTVLMLPDDESMREDRDLVGIKVRKPATLPELLSTVRGVMNR